MTRDAAGGFAQGIKCVLMESEQWKKMTVEHHAANRKNEMAVSEALLLLAENMTKALHKTMLELEQAK